MKQTPRFEEEIYETLDPHRMVGKSLVDAICKNWNETFVDEDTKEEVTIERSEILVKRGVVTKEVASSIQFYIDSGDITEPVKISNINRTGEHQPRNSYRPMLVKVHDLRSVNVICWSDTFDHAQIVVGDFVEQISNGWFLTSDVSNINATVIDNPEAYKLQEERMEKLPLLLNPFKFYQINVAWKEAGSPYPFVNPSPQAKENIEYATFICMADSIKEAQDIISPEITRRAYSDNKWTKIETHWEKGTPYNAGLIVPKEFCDKYNEYFQSLNK